MAMSEADVQALRRLQAARDGGHLWRNNVGVLKDDRGVPVRYGLANETPALNKALKSSDLIGWRPVLITPGMVGQTIAQFVSVECKREGWHYTGAGREAAQKAWLDLVTGSGGLGMFDNGTEE